MFAPMTTSYKLPIWALVTDVTVLEGYLCLRSARILAAIESSAGCFAPSAIAAWPPRMNVMPIAIASNFFFTNIPSRTFIDHKIISHGKERIAPRKRVFTDSSVLTEQAEIRSDYGSARNLVC